MIIMNYKCINCNWKGDEPRKHAEAKFNNKCPICGDEILNLEVFKDIKKAPSTIKERVKEFVDDLKDDGKRNYSNNSKKKSPGRKPKKKGGKR